MRYPSGFTARAAALLIAAAPGAHAQSAGGGNAAPALKIEAAHKAPSAIQAPVQGAARAGRRIVAVGDYGAILLSDDDGKTYRQAAAVPVATTLTAVSFVDARHGWAVGHWGVILKTDDGGEHWRIQRTDMQEDRPLFSVHFFDGKDGVAVGLWSLVLVTRNGGNSWEAVTLPAPPDGGRADRNLFKLFASAHGALYAAAERGVVLSSEDRGQHWQYLNTGYKGSFWTGLAAQDGSLFVAGLRGSLYRSTDSGQSWQALSSGTQSSITDLVESGGKLVGTALNGVQLESGDHGGSFKLTQRADRLSLTAAVASVAGTVVSFSKRGPAPPAR